MVQTILALRSVKSPKRTTVCILDRSLTSLSVLAHSLTKIQNVFGVEASAQLILVARNILRRKNLLRALNVRFTLGQKRSKNKELLKPSP